jgi:hypothetical protein
MGKSNKKNQVIRAMLICAIQESTNGEENKFTATTTAFLNHFEIRYLSFGLQQRKHECMALQNYRILNHFEIR